MVAKGKLKVGDEVEILVRVDKVATKTKAKVVSLRTRGDVAELDMGGRIVTVFVSQVVKVK